MIIFLSVLVLVILILLITNIKIVGICCGAPGFLLSDLGQRRTL